jgi:hypothetical protein
MSFNGLATLVTSSALQMDFPLPCALTTNLSSWALSLLVLFAAGAPSLLASKLRFSAVHFSWLLLLFFWQSPMIECGEQSSLDAFSVVFGLQNLQYPLDVTKRKKQQQKPREMNPHSIIGLCQLRYLQPGFWALCIVL